MGNDRVGTKVSHPNKLLNVLYLRDAVVESYLTSHNLGRQQMPV
jgi:hypothetical protein